MSGTFFLEEPVLALSHFQMLAFVCTLYSFFSPPNKQPACLEAAAATEQFALWPNLAVPVSCGSEARHSQLECHTLIRYVKLWSVLNESVQVQQDPVFLLKKYKTI